MNTTIISILTTVFILFSMINASGQTCPNKNLQRQMQTEETAFLANMKPGLQHTQMLAVGRHERRLFSVGTNPPEPQSGTCTAGHDILFDQTAELARRLQHLGHPLSYHVFPTATHLFITVPGQPAAFQESVRIVSRFLNE